MIAARAAALEALAPEHREAAAAAQRQAKERSKARKAERLEYARRIFALHDEGHTSTEIGRLVGRQRQLGPPVRCLAGHPRFPLRVDRSSRRQRDD